MSYESEIKQTIEGQTFDECTRKLYEKYGNDYKILNRESIFKPVFFGLKTKEIQRVTYIVKHHKSFSEEDYIPQNVGQAPKYVQPQQQIQKPLELRNTENEERKLKENRDAILNIQTTKALTSIVNKMDEVTKRLDSFNNLAAKPEINETIQKIDQLLEENEFTPSYIRMIEEKIKTSFTMDELQNFELVEASVIDWIGQSIQIAEEKVFRPPHVVILIGPTGVGKTTTLAKLAATTIVDAKNRNLPSPKLCVFTIDTMRVGAHEQLIKLGELIHEQVLKAQKPSDVKEIYEEYKNHVDYIFVDTAGYSPNDATHIGIMKNVLDVNMNPDVYLSVTASTKASDLQDILRNYEPLAYESLIITKCDETKHIGNIVSILWNSRKSVSYITDGQNLARNLHKANAAEFLKRLTGFKLNLEHIENKFGNNIGE